MKRTLDHVLAPKTGMAVMVKRGQRLKVTNIEGKQVVDMAVFNRENPREKLSTSYSRTRYAPKSLDAYVPRDRIMEGDVLMSTICRPMMRFVAETPEPKGVHDVHHRMCNSQLYETFGLGPRKGCFEIISEVMAPHGIRPEDLPDTMDLFMNYHHDCARGRWVIDEPVSKAGDYVEFEALMDVIVALSNCPMDVLAPVNAFRAAPMRVEVFEI